MVKAYDELVEFIASGTKPETVVEFRPSDQTKARVSQLIEQEKQGQISAEERSELEHYLQLEHLMRLAKAKARQYLQQ